MRNFCVDGANEETYGAVGIEPLYGEEAVQDASSCVKLMLELYKQL
jgi:hypothetical protein